MKPILSIVVTARNDDHGGDLISRIQTFLDGWRMGATEERLKSEIILVEWNPPQEKPFLSDVLQGMTNEWMDLRCIRVPQSIHQRFAHSDRLPLYQMIAKNVGIRRADGEWILATNVDILFNRPMIRFLRDAPLDPSALYRATRFDCGQSSVPLGMGLDAGIAFCERNLVRINANNRTIPVPTKQCLQPIQSKWDKPGWIEPVIAAGMNRPLFSNACGDFTLMHCDAWEKMRGYPEIPLWSIYIDGLALHAALGLGLHQIELMDPLRIYHIEHGGGWAVDKNSDKNEISLDYVKHYQPWCRALVEGSAEPVNPPDWGLANLNLEETTIRQNLIQAKHHLELQPEAV